MSSYMSITIVGYLGRDPEARTTPTGRDVTNFSVPVNRKYTDSNGTQVEETTWFRITAWEKLAKTCKQYLKKGSLVLIEGRIVPDPKTGSPRIYEGKAGPGASYEINANTVRFLGSGNGNGASADVESEPALEGSGSTEFPF